MSKEDKKDWWKPTTLLGFIIFIQIVGFVLIICKINGSKLILNDVDKFAFLNFWLAFLAVLLAVIGIIVPYLSYSSIKEKMHEVDEKLKAMNIIEQETNPYNIRI